MYNAGDCGRGCDSVGGVEEGRIELIDEFNGKKYSEISI